MKHPVIYNNINEVEVYLAQNNITTSITIGKFDALHLGHEKIFNSVKNLSLKYGTVPFVMVFFPGPESFFIETQTKNIRSINHRVSLILKAFDMNVIIFVKAFDDNFSKITADNFITDFLITKLRARSVSVGSDFRFGFKREGDVLFLKQKSETHGIFVDSITKQHHELSSSFIKSQITKGNVEVVNKMLGLNSKYSIDGTVCKGLTLARKLGFKTANIIPDQTLIMPQFGVYKTKTYIKNKAYDSISNIGIKPSIKNSTTSTPTLETHIFNFNKNIYGKKITIEFLEFIRPEVKFNSIEALKTQIKLDINLVKAKLSVQKTNNAIVFSSNALGDSIISSSVINELIKLNNQIQIVIYQENTIPEFLLQNSIPKNFQFAITSKRKQLKGIAKIIDFIKVSKQIRKNNFDIAINLSKSSIYKQALMSLTKAKLKINVSGLNNSNIPLWKSFCSNFCNKFKIPLTQPNIIDLSINNKTDPISYNNPSGQKIITIAIGASTSERMWNAEKFKTLCEKLALHYKTHQIYLVGGSSSIEISSANIISSSNALQSCGRYKNLVGKTSLPELLHTIQTSDLIISNDSGTMHLGVACGSKTLCILAHTSPEYIGYEKDNFFSVSNISLSCYPCNKPRPSKYCVQGFNKKTDFNLKCLAEISVEQVFLKVTQIITVT